MSYARLRRRVESLEQDAPAEALPAEITAALEYRNDPLGFVMGAFPWGQPGTPLEKEDGPDEWQKTFLQDLSKLLSQREFDGVNPVDPIQMAVASGHGIGKSTLIAWLHWWIMCTRPHSKGRVTANTFIQLSVTTWAEIQLWFSKTRSTSGRLHHPVFRTSTPSPARC